MNRKGLGYYVLFFLAYLLYCPGAALAENYIPGEVVVGFRKEKINLTASADKQKGNAFANEHGLEQKRILDDLNVALYRIKNGAKIDQVIAKIKNKSEIGFVQPNYKYSPAGIGTDDIYKDNLWGLDNEGQFSGSVSDADIDAPEAWQISEGPAATIVAVIDTGVGYNHPDINGNMWDGSACQDENNAFLGDCLHGYDFENYDKVPLDNHGHGTHIAGTIAAAKNNAKGTIGIAPKAKIMAIRTSLTSVDNAAAIRFAQNNGAKVINASWVGTSSSCLYDELLYNSIANFSGLFVAAAGNDNAEHNGSTYFTVPADFGHDTGCWDDLPNVISVAATDYADNLAGFSDYGAGFVDVAAPGQSIFSLSHKGLIAHENDFQGVTPPALPAGFTTGGTTTSSWRTTSASINGVATNVLWQGTYANNQDFYIKSPQINTGTTTAGYLNFLIYCDTEYFTAGWKDYLALEYSTDGVNFFEQQRFDEAELDDDAVEQAGGLITDYSVITPAASSFYYRFRWVTDGFNNSGYSGCFLDDIEIEVLPRDGSGEKYAYMSGTSMAAPHVAGLAGLIWGYNSILTAVQVKNIIMATGDSLASLSGKTISGKRINARNALAVFSPRLGYAADDVIPAEQISQSTAGDGMMTVNFKVRDGISGAIATLNSFSYSTDGGTTWLVQAAGDDSEIFSADWEDNDYSTAPDYNGAAYSFSFVAGNNGQIPETHNSSLADVKIRFKVDDGATTSPYVVSEAFTIDNLAESLSVAGSQETQQVDAASYAVSGTFEPESIVTAYSNDSGNPVIIATTTIGAATSSYLIDLPLAQDTINNFYLVAVDKAGNVSASVSLPAIYEGYVAPVISLKSVGADSSAPFELSSSSVRIELAVESGASCRWSYADEAYSLMPTDNDCATSGTSSSCQINGLPDGPAINLFFSCLNSLGRENDAGNNQDVSLENDLSAPFASNLTVQPNPAGAGSVMIDLAVSDAMSEINYSATPTINILGLKSEYGLAVTSFQSGHLIGSFTLLDEDEEVTATIAIAGLSDVFGNSFTGQTGLSLMVDTIAPLIAPPVAGGGSGGGSGGAVPVPVLKPENLGIKINNGTASTSKQLVAVGVTATNMELANGPLEMMVSNYQNFLGASWNSLSNLFDWQLLPNAGLKSVYIKLRNKFGENFSSASIELLPSNFATSTEAGPEVKVANGASQVAVTTGQKVESDLNVKNKSLYQALKGKIIIRPESKGQAYYVDPNSMKAYYLGRPSDAFSIMRSRGIGITNRDLLKITPGLTKSFYLDSDKDGLPDYVEEMFGTDKKNPDSDGDGFSDGKEVYTGFNPAGDGKLTGYPKYASDTDGDGLVDFLEEAYNCQKDKLDSDGDGFSDINELKGGFNPFGPGKYQASLDFAEKQKGKIFLQIEQSGQAWYINKSDGKRYFLGRPTDAFYVMRDLGLGISEANLEKLQK